MNYTPINKGNVILESPERTAEFEKKRGHGCEDAYAENRRQWSEFPQKQFVADYPLHVDLELASVCNLRCPMCYTITDEFKQQVNAKFMDFDLFTKLVDECAAGGVYSIRLSLRGESFLHKRIIDCIRYAKNKGIQEVSSLTNGVKLDVDMFREVMDAGLDWLTISVDGMGETYNAIRKPGTFDQMVEKLTNFKATKEEAGRVKPVLKVQSIFPAIADAPQAFYETLAPITDMVASNPLIDYLSNDDVNSIKYCKNFSCPQLYQRLTIAADGQVLLCSNDEVNEAVLGDANVQTIHDVWHCDLIEKARAIHKAHRGHIEIEACKKCYIPRATKPETILIDGREVIMDQYINRSQVIGR